MRYWHFVLLSFLFACNPGSDAPDQLTEPVSRLFELMDSEETGLQFSNLVENTDQLNIFNYRNFYNGGGVAIGDLNGDSLPEVYLTANMGENKLYLNKGAWEFEDLTEQAGVALEDFWSTGVVLVDINSDGLRDIYVCNAGYRKGKSTKNVLYINKGNMQFEDQAAAYGLDDDGYTTHAAFIDYDKDGDLDAYILNNSFIPVNTLNYSNKRDLPASEWPVQDFLKGGGDRLLRNDNGRFVDVSEEAGIYRSLIGFGLGVSVADVNEDGWDDLYISNDFFEKDYLYVNQKDGTFSEQAGEFFGHISHSSMGADFQDINNDGRSDLFVTDMLPASEYRLKTNASFDDFNLRRLKVNQGFYHQYMHNTLQVNEGGSFQELAFAAGVAATDWSWGAMMFDADNDSRVDIYVCNGIYRDVIDLDFMDFFANEILQEMALSGEKEDMQKVIDQMPSQAIPNHMFRNEGNANFSDQSANWGLDQPSFSNGSAYADLDLDGDLDFVVNCVNQPALLYQNHSETPGLVIELKGPEGNREGYGARIYAYQDGQVQFRQRQSSRGFQSSTAHDLHFGLGTDSELDSIRVIWPDDRSQLLIPDKQNGLLTLDWRDAADSDPDSDNGVPASGIFEKVTGFDFPRHQEDEYVDYYQERGIYRMLSREGPGVAVADVNADGLDDIYYGAAQGYPASLWIQSAGTFEMSRQDVFSRHYFFEDVDARFADLDGDGDQDLIVGSGGNFGSTQDERLADRIYLNDGSGNFEYDSRFKPSIYMNTSRILAEDFDQDGDIDLLFLSRSVPQQYGFSPVHLYYENQGDGTFTEQSEKVFDRFKGMGMLTDGVFCDLQGDNHPELVLVGDWEAPQILEWKEDHFERLKHNLVNHKGWYYRVISTDWDGDGDLDLIFGNHGINSYFGDVSENPLKLWLGDFDSNSYMDRILTQRSKNQDRPVLLKKDLADQVISIKKAGIKHQEYAEKELRELLPEGSMDGAAYREFNYPYSFVALNNGSGDFEIELLDAQAQWSSLHALYASDFNGDGQTDLIAGGNDFDFLPQFSRLDANRGILISKNSDEENSINVALGQRDQMKDILAISVNGESALLVVSNSRSPQIYRINERIIP